MTIAISRVTIEWACGAGGFHKFVGYLLSPLSSLSTGMTAEKFLGGRYPHPLPRLI